MNFHHIGRRIAPVFVLFALAGARPAHAVSKDMVQLQTEVQQIIDSLARLQSANDQQMGVLKDLVQQTVDSVNKMTVTVNGMQLKLQNQSDAQSTRNDQISGQVQALNDSLDELKARMMRMEKSLNDIQAQGQSTAAIIGNLPGASGAAAGGGAALPSAGTPIPAPTPAPSSAPAGPPSASAPTDLSPNGGAPATGTAPVAGSDQPAPLAAGAAASAGVMYRTAYNDYVSGKYPLATSEFQDLIKVYPDNNLSGNAYFYIGEMDVRNERPTAAIKNYDLVVERYPDNPKIPAARLHKGEALIATKQTEAGERELRSLIQRYPNSPEASQARSRLSALGVARR